MMLVCCRWVAEITAFSSRNLGIYFVFFTQTYIFSDSFFFLPALPVPIFIFLPAFPHSHGWYKKLYEKCENALKSNKWCCFPGSSGPHPVALLKSSSVSVEGHKIGCFYRPDSVRVWASWVFISLTKLSTLFLVISVSCILHLRSVVNRIWISIQVSWTKVFQIK